MLIDWTWPEGYRLVRNWAPRLVAGRLAVHDFLERFAAFVDYPERRIDRVELGRRRCIDGASWTSRGERDDAAFTIERMTSGEFELVPATEARGPS